MTASRLPRSWVWPVVLRLIAPREGFGYAAAGVAIGVGGAMLSTRALASLLYGITAPDLTTFAAVPLILTIVALFATLLPAYRAASVNPVKTLRHS